ncbi:MAG: outer membrane beta-barrel protein [Gemmatimonadales bacterium]
MKRLMAIAAVAGSALLAATAPVSAQRIAPNQFAIDGAIGFAIPTGDYGNALNTGFDLMAALEYHPAQTGPLSFRAEVGWDHFGVSGFTASSNITHLAIDALYDVVIPNSLLQPYALAGFGIYNVSEDIAALCGTDAVGNPVICNTDNGSSTGVGINLGGGLRYLLGRGAQAYFEARYTLAFTGPGELSESPYFPFQFGVRYLLR